MCGNVNRSLGWVGFEKSPEKELEGDGTSRRPCILVVFRFGKCQVEQLGAGTVSFPDELISHAAGGFVVVAWPAAIQINSEWPFWLCRNALQQIVPFSECTRQTGNFPEDLRPLPSEIKKKRRRREMSPSLPYLSARPASGNSRRLPV